MTEIHQDIQLLESEIAKSVQFIEKIEIFYDSHIETILSDKSDIRNAITISEIFVNYYTCIETIFFRIASFFENNLSKDRWHTELLKRMTLKVNGIREQVISDKTYEILDEFRRFRHFKRYYFDFSYDWDKLEFLKKKFDTLRIAIKQDINSFNDFLDKLKD
ncbi:MAG: hypothetical protein HQK77_00210 [Desulfobacterales bacterium]|nr:hypothetical protein [Desulfobacterales bacterium]